MGETIFKPAGKTLTVERVLKAPRDKVWKAWTNAEEFVKWWGPRGWETTVKEMNFTEGGRLLYGMKCMDEKQTDWYGQESWGLSVYSKIDEPNGFTYTDQFCDSEGIVNTDMPTMVIDMKFEELPDGSTKIISYSEFASEDDLKKVTDMGMEQGLKETWDRLDELVSNS